MEPRQQIITVPAAIIIAAAIVAIALIYAFAPAKKAAPEAGSPQQAQQAPQPNLAPVTTDDHIFGNPNAPVKIVEFSDPSCPYCKMFNPTMEQVMSTYGASGKVAWIYRSFPLDKQNPDGSILHPNAGRQSQALECAASIGGNEAFWKFEKEWYDSFPLQGATQRSAEEDTKALVDIATKLKLNTATFSTCLSTGQTKNKVEAHYIDGINAGVSGTPYSVIIGPSGNKIPLVGAVSFATLKTTIDTLLAEKTGSDSK